MKHQLLLAVCILASTSIVSQIERSVIIENKIKAITETIFQNGDTTKKEVFKYIYSTSGDDSIAYYNGSSDSKYVAKKDLNGRTTELALHVNNEAKEVHIYNYNKNGSYSIEKIAPALEKQFGPGTGRLSLAVYDKNHRCMEEMINESTSLVYIRNAHGKTEKILLKGKDNKTEVIAVFYFDKTGLPIKGEGTTDGGQTIYFKYNDRKLVAETKTVSKAEGKETTVTVLLEYEFYEN
jgi:hypothetical protein